MKRRGITVAFGAVLVAVFTWQVLGMDVAYVAMSPGQTVDVLGTAEDEEGVDHQIISVDEEQPTSGELRLTTVSVRQKVTVIDALQLWMSDDAAVVPRELVYAPGKSRDEIVEEQEKDWATSQSHAEQAALKYLGQPLTVTVVDDADPLREGDVLREVDGDEIATAAEVEELAGDDHEFTVERDGEEETVTDVDPGAVELEFDHADPYNIDIDAEALEIGGPSAGLMFTLGILDRIMPEDLTGGFSIAGTGTIDANGEVGPIGGVQQKVKAVEENDIGLFLTPADNCDDAKPAAEGTNVELAKVNTLSDAVEALEAYANGEELPQTC
ncbi:YlbL family protein [Haloglycomyces albus]|uniref:YlbL family protein n=1 Tax=Haloglycomyces albus TaxID=526067 RepID=UPI00046C9A0A|nr:S16 family serine protease [Haloglycomyces albus]